MLTYTLLENLEHILKVLLNIVKTEKSRQFSPTGSRGSGRKHRIYESTRTYDRNTPVGFYCHKSGHARGNCYHALRVCFECGSGTHFVRQCPIKRELSRSLHSLSFSSVEESPTLLLPSQIAQTSSECECAELSSFPDGPLCKAVNCGARSDHALEAVCA